MPWLARSSTWPPPAAWSVNQRAARRRAEHAHRQQAERALGEQLAHVRYPVDRAPLVADRADDAGALGRVDDRPRVVQVARDRLLEVDGEAALECRDGDLAVQRAAACSTSTASGSPCARAATPSRRRPPRPVRPAAQARRPGSGSQTQATSSPSAFRFSRCVSAIQPQPISADSHATTSPFLQYGARTPAHLGSVPDARIESLAERRRRERPRRLGIPDQQIGGQRPPRPPSAAQEAGRQLDRKARVVQARRQHQRHARRDTRAARDELVERGGRARAAVRVIGADRCSASRRARPARRPRRARAGAAAARSRPSGRAGRRRPRSSSSRYCGQVSPVTSSPSARARRIASTPPAVETCTM